jgi:Xaa-Pro dipeptidase
VPACECRRIETTFGTTELTSGREVARKVAAVRGLLARAELPAVVLRGTDGVAWVTGGLTNRIESGSPASAAWVVVTPDELHVVTTNVELPRLRAEAALDGFDLHGADWWAPEGFSQLAEQLAGAPEARIGGLGVDVEEDLTALRLPLDADEQERLAALAADATFALEDAVRQWTPGELDVDVQACVAAGLERAGAFGACLIVGGDDRVERFRHPLAARRPIERLVMAVVVAERAGLHAAATRFASAGAPAGSVRSARRVAADVERAVLDASRPSSTFGDAVGALAGAYAAAGYDGEWRHHYQGGPVGYRQREFELAPGQTGSRWFDLPIAAGTAVAWNPSVAGGGKCEDTYLVLEDGLRRLTDTGGWPLEEDGRPAILDVSTGGAA